MLLHKYRCRDAVFFCTRVSVFWHYHRSKRHHKLNLEQLVQQARVTGNIPRILRSQQELVGTTLRSNIFIHTLVKQGACKKWLHTQIQLSNVFKSLLSLPYTSIVSKPLLSVFKQSHHAHSQSKRSSFVLTAIL